MQTVFLRTRRPWPSRTQHLLRPTPAPTPAAAVRALLGPAPCAAAGRHAMNRAAKACLAEESPAGPSPRHAPSPRPDPTRIHSPGDLGPATAWPRPDAQGCERPGGGLRWHRATAPPRKPPARTHRASVWHAPNCVFLPTKRWSRCEAASHPRPEPMPGEPQPTPRRQAVSRGRFWALPPARKARLTPHAPSLARRARHRSPAARAKAGA